ncbi:MAG: flagellar assembly protein FliX, partial [Alphaproteobacteria bacterium]
MRVSGTTTKGTAATVRRSERPGARGFNPAGGVGGDVAVAGTSVLGSIDALAALQEVDGADAGDGATAAARGAALLADLEALRDGLLAGAADDATLARLRERLGARHHGRLDRGLEAVLADIELRAAVELAKREPAA